MRFSYPLVLAVLFTPVLSIAACGGVESQASSEATSGAGTTTAGATTTTGGGGSGGAGSSTTAAVTTTGPTTVTTGSGGPDIGQPSDVYPAKHPAPPKVVYAGGPVLQAAKFYPVYFADDDPSFTAKATDFTKKFGATDHWKQTTLEYGCGPATGADPIQLTENAPAKISDDDLQAWLANKFNTDDPKFPVPDDNTAITLFYPTGTIITHESGMGTSSSCVDFGGYHNSIVLDAAHGNKAVPYLVIPRCDNFGGMTGIDAVTSTTSHEMMEAATDPTPLTNPAYGQVDNYHLYWVFVLGGGETSDLCAQDAEAFIPSPEIGYYVQRSWSNKSIAAGHDPCVPAPDRPYFNAVPVLNDNINVGGLTMKGVKIPVGQTKTVELDLFSDAKTSGPFAVQVYDVNEIFGGKPELDLTLDADAGLNGQKLHVDIQVLKKGQYGIEIFFVFAELNGVTNTWLGLVGN